MPLTDMQAKKAAPKDKPYRLTDGAGMYLEISPAGGKYWRLKFRVDGKEKRLALGVYPEVTLGEARIRRDDARRLISQGIDPSEKRKIDKRARSELAANTFEAVSREWYAKRVPTWSEKYASGTLARLEQGLFPWIGAMPIQNVKATDLLACLRRIEQRGAIETAHRTKGIAGEIFRYAIATGRAERDAAADLKGALTSVRVQHLKAVTEPKAVGALLRAIDAYEGGLIVRSAFRLGPLLFVRPGELRAAKWAEIDLDVGEWRYRVGKTGIDHIVPLCSQALAILKELQPLTGHGVYVFRSERGDRPMSENTLRVALIAVGYGDLQTAHGFRATARTLLDEELGYPPHIIEQQLAHAVQDPMGRAYNRTAHLAERRRMMQEWADYLDRLKVGAEVVPLRPRSTG
jgi:integrase